MPKCESEMQVRILQKILSSLVLFLIFIVPFASDTWKQRVLLDLPIAMLVTIGT